MGNFREYAERLDRICKEAFGKLDQAERAEREARAALGQFRQHPSTAGTPMDAETARRLAAATDARAAAFEAGETLKSVRRSMDNYRREIQDVRDELDKKIKEMFLIDPKKVDEKALVLFKSGQLKPDELIDFVERYRREGNRTMLRLMIPFVEKALETVNRSGADRRQVEPLAVVLHDAKSEDGSELLEGFDSICRTFERAIRNPRLRGTMWDELVAPAMEIF